ncbi:DUF1513 domain-containing protein [Steroidobacter sp. S1-65]|uniref:DUF1513 domain-containing protein n=1 Tax=Steroidobacter gossypii TaxID=2805490 RepID=A0ABS1WUC7_9GAMM|nr:DUF1513 domain-containing protein [Steroidobacter gossypii]MBM0104576.1 DUF1513 domain-containing protein [Steroidobacter gossypii]
MPVSKLSRRQFLLASASLSAVAAGGLLFSSEGKARTGTLLSAFEDARGDQYVGGLSLQDEKVFGARVPMRAHGCAVHPTDPNRVLFFARRPGTQAFELDRTSMQARVVFTTQPGRHLAGHGSYSANGDLIFTPEHDYERVRGVVVVRDARNFEVVGELDTQGIDPHEVAWMPDHRSLLVANGGIMTHPRTFRRKLNIPTMDPSLCVLDAASGECQEQWRLPDHLLSIRHVSMTASGITAVGLQYEGNKEQAPGIVALYRPAAAGKQAQFRLLTAPPEETPRFQGYVASVAISEAHDLIAAACPYGGGVACWSLREERYLGFIAASETYGLSRVADGSIVASQRDGTAYDLDESRLRSQFLNIASSQPIRWDDHWVATA